MPNVPPPDQCLLEEEWLLQLTESESNKVHPKLKEFFQILAAVSNETAGYWLEWYTDLLTGEGKGPNCHQTCKGTRRRSGRNN